ncbi:MAG TPA: hypothetical protein VI072_13935 [Polyangiaceae bacterium]
MHTGLAAAQEPAPPAPPAEAPAEPPPAEAAPPADAPPAEAPPAAAAPPEPPPAPAVPAPAPAPAAIAPEDAPAALAEEAEKKPVNVGIGLRANMRFQNPNDQESLDDQYMDQLYGELRLSGEVHEKVAWQMNFNVSGRSVDAGNGFEARAMDMIAQFNFHDYIHLWAGRMLVAMDRSNLSGPWFMSPWYYPGLVNIGDGLGFFPRTKQNGRDVGVNVWGQFGDGLFKYYAGVYDLDVTGSSPLYAGRLNLALLDTEPGFYSSSTYYGAKKQLVAIGVGGEYQDNAYNGADDQGDYQQINADLLAEFDLNGSGVLTGEAAYYHWEGDSSSVAADDMLMVLGSYLFPQKIGWGKPQLIGRVQQMMNVAGPEFDDITVLDGEVSYVVADYNMKVNLGYQHTIGKIEGPGDDFKGHLVHIGAQIQH